MSALKNLAASIAAHERVTAVETAARAAAIKAANQMTAVEAATEGSFMELLEKDDLARVRRDRLATAEKALAKMAKAKTSRDAAAKAIAEAQALVAKARRLGLDAAEAAQEIRALHKGLDTCRGNLGRAKAEAERAIRALEAIGGALDEGSEAAKTAEELKARAEAEAKAKAKARARAEAEAAKARALRALDAPAPSLGERVGDEVAAALQALIRA